MNAKKLARLAALCLFAAPGFAANTPTQMDLDRAVMVAQRRAIVNRAMNLDDDSASRFWPLYDQYVAARAPVDDQMYGLITQYARNYQKMSDEEAMKLVTGLVQVQDAKNKVRSDFVQKFYKLLPGRVVARFFQVDNKLDAFLSANLGNLIPLVPTADLQTLAGPSTPAVLTPNATK